MLNQLRFDSAHKQKRGIHFILASVILWSVVWFIHQSTLPILTKNLYTFFATAPLLPLAFLISRILKIDFQNKANPLTNLGVLFSLNQMLYLLIAMWVFQAVPEKMVMVLAMIFGAHLLPYGWLYQSKAYYAFSVIIPFVSLFLGLTQPPSQVALALVGIEIGFSLWLAWEYRRSLL